MNEQEIKSLQFDLFKNRFDLNIAANRIKDTILTICKKCGIKKLIFNDDVFETHGNIYALPMSDNALPAKKVIGFEIKVDRGTEELELIYNEDNQEKRCYIFETYNEESIYVLLSSIMDYYLHNELIK